MNNQKFHKQTGSRHLIRYNFFNVHEPNVDVPDGDVEFGKQMFKQMCLGCHEHIGSGPSLISIYGMRGGRQKAFLSYSPNARSGIRWSKERIYQMLENPEEFFGLESGMLFDGIKDPYVRASIIEYLQFMRLTEPLAYKPKEHIYT